MPKREWLSQRDQIFRLSNGRVYARPVIDRLGRKELALGMTYQGPVSELDPKLLRKMQLVRDKKVAALLRSGTPKHASLQRVEDLAREIVESKRMKAEKTLVSAKLTIEKHLIPWINEHAPYFDDWGDRGETLWQQYIDCKRSESPGLKLFNHRKHLQMILLRAFERGILKRRVKVYDPDPPVNVGKLITPSEIQQLYQHATPTLRDQILMAYSMGFRKSEILRLEWDRVNFARNEITLRSEHTKTRKPRVVPMSASVREMLLARHGKRKSPYVFWSRMDRKRYQASNASSWRAAKKDAGVTARFHDLRHSFITQAVRQGMNPLLICKYAGLGQEVMARVYCHLDTSDLKKVADMASEILGEIFK